MTRSSRRRRAGAMLMAAAVSLPLTAQAAESGPTSGEPTTDESGGDVDDLPAYEPDAAPVVEPTADYAYDRWVSRWGQSLADVPVGDAPDTTELRVGDLETPVNTDDQYAHRMRTLFTPVESGRYRFHLAGDDDARLFFNPTGSDPVGAVMIAYLAGWTTLRQWDRFDSQASDWVELTAGTSYYLEAIGKEGSGDDHVSVGLEREGGDVAVIPAELIEATDLGVGGWRVRTPQGLPALPVSSSDPGWRLTTTPDLIELGWTAVDGAEWYQVRLEGSGQVVEVDVAEPQVAVDGLVPDSRHLVEVVPMNAAGAASPMTRVVLTDPGAYPIPVAPTVAADATPSVAYDRWDTGWWTLTSIPDGYQPWFSGTLAGGLETPPMQGERHAARLRAVLTPTVTDDYTFFLSSDDDSRLLLNPLGPSADGAIPVAYVSGWTEQYQWDRYQSQRTATFRLEAGEQYYVEALAVHALDIDHLEVGWQRGDGPIEVVPADVLTPTMAGSGGWRPDAADLPNLPGKPKHLRVDSTPTSLHATWEPAKEHDEYGDTAFYEVVITGEGLEITVLVDETSLVVEELPSGGRFWFEVRPWNASGQGRAAAHTVHTDRARDDSPGGDARVDGGAADAVVVDAVDDHDDEVGVFAADESGDQLVSTPPLTSPGATPPASTPAVERGQAVAVGEAPKVRRGPGKPDGDDAIGGRSIAGSIDG